MKAIETVMDDRIKKLPVWAQEIIEDLAQQRETAVRALNKYADDQTPSPFYIDELECTGEEKCPSKKTRYIQTRKIAVEHAGVHLSILLRDGSIDLQWWESLNRGAGQVAFVPKSFQAVDLIAKENMR